MAKTQKFTGVVKGYGISVDVATKIFGYDFKFIEIRDIYMLNGVNPGTYKVGAKWVEDGVLRAKEIVSTDKGMYNELLNADEPSITILHGQLLETVIGTHKYATCRSCGKIMVSKRCGWCGSYKVDSEIKEEILCNFDDIH